MKNDRTTIRDTPGELGTGVPDSSSSLNLKKYIQDKHADRPLFINYLKRLWQKHSSVRLGAVTGASALHENIPLPAVYTALDTDLQIQIGRQTSTPSGSSRWFVPSQSSYLHQRISTESMRLGRFAKGYSRPITALEMLEYSPRLVLVGPAGSGKSTFIQFVTLCLAGEILGIDDANLKALNGDVTTGMLEPWPHGVLLPISIELKMFARSVHFPDAKTTGTAAHLLEYISSTLLPGRDPDIRDYLHNQASGAILMLDGLDEVPEAVKIRERMREIIIDVAEAYPDCRILVTSRPYAYRDPSWRLDPAGFKEASLSELKESQIYRLILNWYEGLEEHGQVNVDLVGGRVKSLMSNIQRSPYLRQLAANPLLLTMLAAVSEQSGGTLPMNRSELYEGSAQLLLDRWNRLKGLGAPALSDDLNTSLQEIRNKLEELAFEVHREHSGKDEGGSGITYMQLSRALEAVSDNGKVPVAQIMDYLHQRSGILVADHPGLFRFPHRSLQEYMAACNLLKRDDHPDLIVRLATESPTTWREVLLFAASRAVIYRHQDVWELVAELCPETVPTQVTQEAEWWGGLFAGLVLNETGLYKQDIPRRHRATLLRILDWLAACVDRGAMSTLERAEVGRILGHLGDPRPGVGLGSDKIPNIVWLEIPSGPFLKGSSDADEEAFQNEKTQEEIELDTYWIGKYAVTVAQFRAYVESGECPNSRRGEIQRRWRNSPESFMDNYPVADVNYAEATAFCRWLEKKLGYEVRLPTEEEWEKAARGRDGRIYPWGNQFDGERCNVMSLQSLCTVGLFPKGASPYGVLDMSGNVWEWCSNLWGADYGASAGIGSRAVRGGSFGSAPEAARCAYRGKEGATLLHGLGFRVATSHKPPNK